MRRQPTTIALSTLLLLSGCPKKGGEALSAEPAEAAQVATVEAAPLELTPVEAPENVIAQLRVQSVAAMLDAVVAEWGEPYDWRAKMAEVTSKDPSLASFDVDAPLDLVVVIDTTPGVEEPVDVAFSVGLSSVDAVAAKMEEDGPLRSLPGQVLRQADSEEKLHCELGPARGKAPAKLVCGNSNEGLDQLGPYLRRGDIGDLALPSSMAMHADFEPVRELFRPQVKEGIQTAGIGGSMAVAGIQDAGLRDAAARALRAAIDEFDHLYDDLGSFTLEWALGGPQGGLSASMSLRMTGKRSFMSRVLLSDEDRMAPAPEDFFKLPASMASGSFTHTRLSEDGKAIGEVVGQLLLGAAREFDFPTKKLQKAVDLYAKVVAQYPDNDALVVTFPSTPGVFGEDWPEELRTQLDNLGIFMIGGPKVPDDIAMFKAWVDVYNDRAMQKKLASFMPDKKPLPKLKWSKVSAKDKLPKGSYEVRLTFPKAWLPADGSVKSLPVMSVMMVPVGDRLWYATSFDRKGMVTALRAIANPSGPTLADDPAAQRFRRQKVAHGAWTKIEQSIVDDVIEGLLEEEDDPAKAAKMSAAHESWSTKWKAQTMPAMTSWSVVDGLTWRSDARVERETTRAYIDLIALLAREFGAGETGALQAIPAGATGDVPAGKSRFGDKK